LFKAEMLPTLGIRLLVGQSGRSTRAERAAGIEQIAEISRLPTRAAYKMALTSKQLSTARSPCPSVFPVTGVQFLTTDHFSTFADPLLTSIIQDVITNRLP
jgi:hypothetical protein